VGSGPPADGNFTRSVLELRMPSPFPPARLCPKFGIGTEWRLENCRLAGAGSKTNPNSRGANGEDLGSRISLVWSP
jgi:hypothetical protein